MTTKDLNNQQNIVSIIYPDNQPHVNINSIKEGEEVKVVCSITESQMMIKLLECSNALDNVFAKKKILSIPYLMGARFDRNAIWG